MMKNKTVRDIPSVYRPTRHSSCASRRQSETISVETSADQECVRNERAINSRTLLDDRRCSVIAAPGLGDFQVFVVTADATVMTAAGRSGGTAHPWRGMLRRSHEKLQSRRAARSVRFASSSRKSVLRKVGVQRVAQKRFRRGLGRGAFRGGRLGRPPQVRDCSQRCRRRDRHAHRILPFATDGKSAFANTRGGRRRPSSGWLAGGLPPARGTFLPYRRHRKQCLNRTRRAARLARPGK